MASVVNLMAFGITQAWSERPQISLVQVWGQLLVLHTSPQCLLNTTVR